MICVSILHEHHGLAFADIVNANRRADLIEIRLDKFDKEPRISELLAACNKPSIVSCPRPQEGGFWKGTERERIAVLTSAVAAGADYVELELDAIDQVPRTGTCQRIVSYTNTGGVPDNLDAIYRSASAKDADIVKVTIPARTPEEAWPLMKLIVQGDKPTVAVGRGPNSPMLNVLGKRYGAPWTYAALEKGAEAYPGMTNTFDLEDIYDHDAISKTTQLLAVSGFGEEQRITCRALNLCFQMAKADIRCLPLELGSPSLFKQIARQIKLVGSIIDETHAEAMVQLVTKPNELIRRAGSADFLLTANDKEIRGFNVLADAVIASTTSVLLERLSGINPWEDRDFLIVGCSGMAKSIATAIQSCGGIVQLADADDGRVRKVATEINALVASPDDVRADSCDFIIITASDSPSRRGQPGIYIPKKLAHPDLVAIDLTDFPFDTTFLAQVRAVGGVVISPQTIFAEMIINILSHFLKQKFKPKQVLSAFQDFVQRKPV